MTQPIAIPKKVKKTPATPSASPTKNPKAKWKATNVPAGGVFSFDDDEESVPRPAAPAKKEFSVPALLLPKKSCPASPRACADSSFPAVIETAAQISSEINNPSAPATN
ncbi:hypothetical protein DL546_002995 [Coniochaeta pulveracea]|uniref:Uncharacterized protein n=1 Tax=Coniochaeta pulveracea TaxID=177199 RepID=A0A420YB59_9PEZI|nr:hypothetical protein DL546_002995 [Coniochaeta pulveracea]